VKKSPKLLLLKKYNSNLHGRAWVNYLAFLDVLLGSTTHPAARELLRLKQSGDFTGMVEYADCLASAEYLTPAEHRLCNQLAAVIRKFPFPSGVVSFDPRKKALETFLKSERKCLLVNRRFRLFDTLRSPHERALSRARQWIQYVLGELRLSEIWMDCDHGPGASIGVNGDATNSGRKFLAESWTVSPGAFNYARAALKSDFLYWESLTRSPDGRFFSLDVETFNRSFDSRARVVDYNKITFVPKTAKTERTIAVEPLLNGYVQKGIDLFMRKRLKRIGINLEDQSKNQELAREGSLEGSDPWVTIDLSSASDSISIGLCRNLLPPDWFDFLNETRSKSYALNGAVKRFEKFCTMGNGFCFPLETLIFASLCHVANCEACLPARDFIVYGDDIIVRQSVASRVLDLLRVCGFKANLDKTFLKGPFRESCGADWFSGEDVRPLTLDYTFDSVESVFKFCNLARRKDPIDWILREACQFLTDLLPPELMFVRPYPGNVDTALEVAFDVFLSSPYSKWHRNLCCWSWEEIGKVPVPDALVRTHADYHLALTRGALMGVVSSAPFTLRRTTRTKIRRVSYAGGWSLYLPRYW